MTRGPDDRKDEENMNFVGIDIGSTASKVSVRGDKEINYVLPTGWSSKETAGTIKEKLLEEGVDVEAEDTKVVATGYGRIAVDYADYVITEITCHARAGAQGALSGQAGGAPIAAAACHLQQVAVAALMALLRPGGDAGKDEFLTKMLHGHSS